MRTRAQIAIFKANDDSGFGLGCELRDNENQLYHIFSLYLPCKEYPNKRQVLHRTLPDIITKIPSNFDEIIFYSASPQFRKRLELIRKNSIYAPGKTLNFKIMKQNNSQVVLLAFDAINRRSSITEKF